MNTNETVNIQLVESLVQAVKSLSASEQALLIDKLLGETSYPSTLEHMTIQEIENQLLSLTPNEKVEAIQILSRSLNQNWRGITKTPGVCGGDACIAGTRIPVWVLVGYRHQGVSESELLAAYPTLSASDLVNAWVYAEAYPEEIAAAIKENEEA